MSKVFVYEIDPIDLPFGTVDLQSLPIEHWGTAQSIAGIFTMLHSDGAYQDSPRFGFFLSLGSPQLGLWSFRKLHNNGTTVIISPVAIDFNKNASAYGFVDMDPYVDHGVYEVHR